MQRELKYTFHPDNGFTIFDEEGKPFLENLPIVSVTILEYDEDNTTYRSLISCGTPENTKKAAIQTIIDLKSVLPQSELEGIKVKQITSEKTPIESILQILEKRYEAFQTTKEY